MRVKKTATSETKLNLAGVRATLYTADAHGATPNEPRVAIIIPGNPESVSADLPLSEVLKDKKKIVALQAFQDAFVQAALASAGLEVQADDLAD
jgi:hypothetical protein